MIRVDVYHGEADKVHEIITMPIEVFMFRVVEEYRNAKRRGWAFDYEIKFNNSSVRGILKVENRGQAERFANALDMDYL